MFLKSLILIDCLAPVLFPVDYFTKLVIMESTRNQWAKPYERVRAHRHAWWAADFNMPTGKRVKHTCVTTQADANGGQREVWVAACVVKELITDQRRALAMSRIHRELNSHTPVWRTLASDSLSAWSQSRGFRRERRGSEEKWFGGNGTEWITVPAKGITVAAVPNWTFSLSITEKHRAALHDVLSGRDGLDFTFTVWLWLEFGPFAPTGSAQVWVNDSTGRNKSIFFLFLLWQTDGSSTELLFFFPLSKFSLWAFFPP